MKRCPTCNQTFTEGWLSFCTADGTTLMEDSAASSSEPPPTIMSPAPPPFSNPNPQANWNTPSGGVGAGQFPAPRPSQPAWQPPPPPAYVAGKQQGLAVASLIIGIFTVTFGWCYVGIVTGPIAIVLGIIALVQIKNKPEIHTGRPMAIAGVVTGAVYVAIVAIIIVFAIIMQGIK